MIRKGWRWKDEDPDPAQMNAIIKIHNKNNELAWQEVNKPFEHQFTKQSCRY